MGRAHSNAYRQVAHFFDVDPAPRMVAICGRDEAGVKEAAEKLGWEGYETDYHALVAAARHPARRRLDPGRHPQGGRPGRAGGGEARPLREAAGQQSRRGARDAGGGAAGGRHRGRQLQLPPGAGGAVRQEADRRRSHRRGAALAGGLSPGLDQRSQLPARLAAEEGACRLRRPRRHRRPHHRSRPLPRRADRRSRRHAVDLHQGAAGGDRVGRRRRAARPSRARRWARSRSTTRRPSWRGSRAAPPAHSRRRGWRRAGATTTASRSTARRARSPSTWSA